MALDLNLDDFAPYSSMLCGRTNVGISIREWEIYNREGGCGIVLALSTANGFFTLRLGPYTYFTREVQIHS